MKQRIIIYSLGLITGLGIWFAYDRIAAYNRSKRVENYFKQYEREDFMVEDKSPEFVGSDIYNMKLVSDKNEETTINKSGKIIFINFWATWCKPCIEEMPAIQELYDKSKENVDFYLLTDEDIDKAVKFIKKKGFTFPIYSYKSKSNLTDYFQFNGGSIPDTYIIYDNQTKFHHLGSAPWNSHKVDSLFANILAGK